MKSEFNKVTLEDISLIKGRIGWKGLKSREYTKNGYPILTSYNLVNVFNGIDYTIKINRVPKWRYEESPDIKIQNGDILMSKITGKVGYVDNLPEKSTVNSTITIIRITENSKALNKFIYYFLKSDPFKKFFVQNTKGTTMSSVNHSSLKKIKIILPTIKSQIKTVSILEKINKIKQMRNESDELTKEYLNSVFLEMFGDPVNNPKRWKVEKLKNHIDLLTGYPFKSKEYTDDKNEVRLCGGLIIMPYGIEWNKANYWKRNSTDGLDRFWLDVGDIVIAMDRPWISSGFKIYQIKDDDVPSLLVQRTARVRVKNINQNFLFWLFRHKSFEIHAKPTETTVPHISPKDIREFEIILPPIELQNEFSEIVKHIEFVKKYQGQSKMNIDNLFKNFTQKTFGDN